MDPLGFVGSAFGSILNWVTNMQNMGEQRALQQRQFNFTARENQKTRDFAKLSQEWANEQNIAQWSRANAFNDPSRVRQRLSQAGVNPDLYYSGGAVPAASSNMPAQSHSPSSNGSPSVSPVESKFDALQAQRLIAETENIKADTAKKEQESSSLSTYNDFQSALLQQQLDLGDSTIRFNSSVVDLNAAQKDQLYGLCKTYDSQVNKLNAEARYFNELWKEYEAKNERAYERVDLELKKLSSELNLNEKELGVLNSVIGLNNSHSAYLRAGTSVLEVTRDSLDFQLNQAETWDDYERAFKIINSTLGTILDGIGRITDFISPQTERFDERTESVDADGNVSFRHRSSSRVRSRGKR